MSTRFYLHNDAAPYTPGTIRGAWNASGSAVTKRLDTGHLPATPMTYVQVAETSTETEYDVLLYRGVTGPIKAATIGTGTVNLMLGVYQNSASANNHWHLHIYATQGDSDTVRGTLLADYREAAGTNEFGTNAATAGMDLNAAAALSSVEISDGDRLVVEIGYTARNTSSAGFNARLAYGYPAWTPALVHGGAYQSGVGYVEFSETFDGTATHRVTQLSGEALYAQTATVRASQVVAEILLPVMVGSRVSQIVAEILFPSAVESRVSQLVAELLDAGVHPQRVSQVVVELLGKSSTYCGLPSLSPAALCGKPDVLAWLEWTVPPVATSPPTRLETVYSSVDLPDPSTYYIGFKDGRVLSFGTATRTLSDLTGQWSANDLACALADTDRSVRQVLTLAKGLRETPVIVRMISDADRRAQLHAHGRLPWGAAGVDASRRSRGGTGVHRRGRAEAVAAREGPHAPDAHADRDRLPEHPRRATRTRRCRSSTARTSG